MRRIIPVLLLLLAPLAGAQQTQTKVTGTITDPNNVPYYPATVLACLTPATTNPTVAGASVSTNIGQPYCVGPAQTSSSGIFQLPLYANSVISCNNVACSTQWQFTVTAAGTAPPAGKGTVSFQVTTSITSLTAQDVTAVLVTAAPVLLNSGGGGGAVGPGTPTYIGCFNTTTNLQNCADAITDNAGTVTIPAIVNIGGGAGTAGITLPAGSISGCPTGNSTTNVVCSDLTNGTIDESLLGGPLAPLGTTQGLTDASLYSGVHWTDKTAAAITALGSGVGVVVVPAAIFNGDDGSATNLTVPSNVTLEFTGSGTLTFCASGNGITMGATSKIFSTGNVLLQMKSGGTCTYGIYLNSQETLQSNDRMVISKLRVDCNSVAGTTGWYFTAGTAMLSTEYNSVSNCPVAGALYNDAQFTHSLSDHFWQNGVNLELLSATGGTNSDKFTHLQTNNPTLGVNVLIAQNGSTIGVNDIELDHPELQNGTVNELCIIGGSSQSIVHVIGGAPEVGGNKRYTATFTNSSASIAATNTYAAGNTVQFDTTGTLPTNFSPDTTYYVIAAGLSGSAFEVSATLNGSAITAGSAGSGTQTVFPVAVIGSFTCRQAMFYANGSQIVAKDMDIAEATATPLFYAANASYMSISDTRGGAGQLTAYADSTSKIGFYGIAYFAGGLTTSGAGTFTGLPVGSSQYASQVTAGATLTSTYALAGGGTTVAQPQNALLLNTGNTNTPAAAVSSVEYFTGRAGGGSLNTGQTVADIAFQDGLASGGYRHFIETQHNAAAGSDTNTFLFYVNNSTTAGGSSAPGTGNVLGFQITPNKIVAPNSLLASGGVYNPNLLLSATAALFNFGFNSGSVTTTNGSDVIIVTVGSGSAGSTGAITLPTATTGWACNATNRSRADHIQQTATSTTTATFTNYGTTFASTNWTNGDVIQITCSGY